MRVIRPGLHHVSEALDALMGLPPVADAGQIAARVTRDPSRVGAVAEALEALAETGVVLALRVGGRWVFPLGETVDRLDALADGPGVSG